MYTPYNINRSKYHYFKSATLTPDSTKEIKLSSSLGYFALFIQTSEIEPNGLWTGTRNVLINLNQEQLQTSAETN